MTFLISRGRNSIITGPVQTAYLMLKPNTVNDSASFFTYMPVGLALDVMKAPKFKFVITLDATDALSVVLSLLGPTVVLLVDFS